MVDRSAWLYRDRIVGPQSGYYSKPEKVVLVLGWGDSSGPSVPSVVGEVGESESGCGESGLRSLS